MSPRKGTPQARFSSAEAAKPFRHAFRLEKALRRAFARATDRIERLGARGPGFPRALAGAFAARLWEMESEARNAVLSLVERPSLFSGADADLLELAEAEVGRLLLQLERELRSDLDRLRGVARRARRRPFPGEDSIRPIEAGALSADGSLQAVELLRFGGPLSREAFSLLAGSRSPDEIEWPLAADSLGRPEVVDRPEGGAHWRCPILVALRDGEGGALGAVEGTVIADRRGNAFHLGAIAIRRELRATGLEAGLLRAAAAAAEDRLREAEGPLGECCWAAGEGGRRLQGEITGVGYPDRSHLGGESRHRLLLLGRNGWKGLWPFRYARPEIDRRATRFDPFRWSSVPMLLCLRSVSPGGADAGGALEAARLLLDDFSSAFGPVAREGVAWERTNIERGVVREGSAALVDLPAEPSDEADFVRRLGWLDEILPDRYPDHRFTRDGMRLFGLLAKRGG
jgi:hypothetical protein